MRKQWSDLSKKVWVIWDSEICHKAGFCKTFSEYQSAKQGQKAAMDEMLRLGFTGDEWNVDPLVAFVVAESRYHYWSVMAEFKEAHTEMARLQTTSLKLDRFDECNSLIKVEVPLVIGFEDPEAAGRLIELTDSGIYARTTMARHIAQALIEWPLPALDSHPFVKGGVAAMLLCQLAAIRDRPKKLQQECREADSWLAFQRCATFVVGHRWHDDQPNLIRTP